MNTVPSQIYVHSRRTHKKILFSYTKHQMLRNNNVEVLIWLLCVLLPHLLSSFNFKTWMDARLQISDSLNNWMIWHRRLWMILKDLIKLKWMKKSNFAIWPFNEGILFHMLYAQSVQSPYWWLTKLPKLFILRHTCGIYPDKPLVYNILGV